MTTKDAETKAVVQWKGEAITISFHDVKSLICPYATNQEAGIFLKTCQSLQLNPFANEIYLIKYSERDKAAMVIAIDAYLKASELNPTFDGFESGTILKDSTGKLEYREGAFILDEERPKLVGGFARVWRKDRTHPFYVSVNKKECLRYRKDGSLTEFWTEEKQPTMLRKVALKRALVEAFPSLFVGAISNVEADYEMLPAEVKEAVPQPRGETPEGDLPPAYEKAGKPDWKLWWVRQKERGLSVEDVHAILGVSSIKENWIEKGRTLEEAEDNINKFLSQIVEKPTDLSSAEKGTMIAVWNEIRTLTQELKPTERRVQDWWKQAYDMDVTLKDFSWLTPPEKFGQGMLELFRNKLKQQERPQLPLRR